MNPLSKNITVSAFKYGGTLHYSWDTQLIEKTETYVLVKGEAGRQLFHHTKNKIFVCPTPSLEFFSLDEGFTVNIDIHPNGELEYYCNIALPSEYKEKDISFTDLDVDLVKIPGEDWKLIDFDEFKSNSRRLNYPKHILQFVQQSIKILEDRIEHHYFPFNDFFDAYIKDICTGR